MIIRNLLTTSIKFAAITYRAHFCDKYLTTAHQLPVITKPVSQYFAISRFLLVMENKTVLLLTLFQGMLFAAVSAAEEESTSRSAHFATQKNKQLVGYVVKQFESRSLLLCGQQCLRNAWCTSTNYKVSSERNDKGTCELNKHELSLVNENTKFHDQEGVTFSMRQEVI